MQTAFSRHQWSHQRAVSACVPRMCFSLLVYALQSCLNKLFIRSSLFDFQFLVHIQTQWENV